MSSKVLRAAVIGAVIASVCFAQQCGDVKVVCNSVTGKDGSSSSFCTIVRSDKKNDAFDDGVCGCCPGGDYSVAWFDDSTQWKNFGSGVDTAVGDSRKTCEDLYNEKDCREGKFGLFLLQGEKPSDKKFYALKTGLKNSIEPTFNSFASMSDGSSCPGSQVLQNGGLNFMQSDKCGSVDGFNGLQKDEHDGFYQRNPYAYGGSYAFVNSRSECPQLRNSWDDWQGIICRKNPGSSSPSKPKPNQPTKCGSDKDCANPGPCATVKCTKSKCVVAVVAKGTPCTANGQPSGDCDVADTCDGVNAECVDAVAPSSKVCRNAAGDCDVAEYCTGLTKECPKNAVAKKGTECRAKDAKKKCDVAESCDGSTSVCPMDGSLAGCTEEAEKVPPKGNEPKPKSKCKFDYNSDCVKCTARTPIKNGKQTVTVDFSACKDKEAIDWFGCRNKNKWGSNVCTLLNCDGNSKNGKNDGVTCKGATTAEYSLPSTETTIELQVKDDGLEGNVECKGTAKSDGSSDCCGLPSGKQGSCGSLVAVFTLSLDKCGVSPSPPADTCSGKCSNKCAKCKVRPENNPTKVVVDFGGCGKSSIDWACCKGTDCEATSCSGGNSHSCDDDDKRNRCDNVKDLVLSVGKNAATVKVQYSDADLAGDVQCSKGGCCGASKSSCSAVTSVCEQEIELESCAECLEDSDCARAEEGCEEAFCDKGTCKKRVLAAGTVCRFAAGECEKDAVCDGGKAQCPTNKPRSKGDVCRASTGPCDEEEQCDGYKPLCPANAAPKAGCGKKWSDEEHELGVEAKMKRR